MRIPTHNFKIGTVKQVTHEDGLPVYDVQLNTGALYKRVPIMMSGRSHFPVHVGNTVHLLFPDGIRDLPYITGSEPSPIEETTTSAGGANDYAPNQSDLVLREANQTLSLSTSGVTIDADNARIQYTDTLRLSKSDVSDNKILNADPFIDELYSYIAELETKLIGLQTAVGGLVSVLTAPQTLAFNASILPLTIRGVVSPPSPSTTSKTRAEGTINDSITIP